MSDLIAVRDDSVSWTPTDDGQVVLLDMRTSRYLSLNASGSLLWTTLVEGATSDRLATALIERFALSADAARADVETFLAALRERDLLAE